MITIAPTTSAIPGTKIATRKIVPKKPIAQTGDRVRCHDPKVVFLVRSQVMSHTHQESGLLDRVIESIISL